MSNPPSYAKIARNAAPKAENSSPPKTVTHAVLPSLGSIRNMAPQKFLHKNMEFSSFEKALEEALRAKAPSGSIECPGGYIFVQKNRKGEIFYEHAPNYPNLIDKLRVNDWKFYGKKIAELPDRAIIQEGRLQTWHHQSRGHLAIYEASRFEFPVEAFIDKSSEVVGNKLFEKLSLKVEIDDLVRTVWSLDGADEESLEVFVPYESGVNRFDIYCLSYRA